MDSARQMVLLTACACGREPNTVGTKFPRAVGFANPSWQKIRGSNNWRCTNCIEADPDGRLEKVRK